MSMVKDVFIDGTTGFAGRDLVRAIAQRDIGLINILVRSDASELRTRAALKDVTLPSQLVFHRGDLTRPFCGVDPEKCKGVREYWHIGAMTDFEEEKREIIMATNVQGSENSFELAHKFENLEAFFNIGSAYKCGKERGIIPEGPFPRPFGFKGPYEESKWLSEMRALEFARERGLPVICIDPSILMGHSKTGAAENEIRMVYGYLLAMYYAAAKSLGLTAYKQHLKSGKGIKELKQEVRLAVDPTTTKNLVPRNYFVDVAMAVREEAIKYHSNIGKVYNVVNPNNLTLEEMREGMEEALKVKGFRIDPSLLSLTHEQRDEILRPEERIIDHNVRVLEPYLVIHEPQWQYANVTALGVKPVLMTPDLFKFLMRSYVERELLGNNNSK
jgi:nucleoside-diphosphate-sugar epimerase